MKTYSSRPGETGRERVGEVPCPACGAAASRVVLRAGDARFVRCRSCRVVYQNPQPVFEDLQRRYSEAYFRYERENEENFFRLMRLGLQDVEFERLTSGLPRPRRFLDVGCATGRLLEHMRDGDWEVRGVELCPQSVAYGRSHRGLDIFAGTLDQASYPGQFFDAIHFSHLIEHVPDPRGLLVEVRRILAPAGHVVVVTPNIDGLQARLFGSRWRSAIGDHLTLFSKTTLRHLLELTGFQSLRVVTWGGLAAGSVPGWLKRPADRLAKRWGFGDVVLILARKTAEGRGRPPKAAEVRRGPAVTHRG